MQVAKKIVNNPCNKSNQMSDTGFLLKRHQDLGKRMKANPPASHSDCNVNKKEISCWSQYHAAHGTAIQHGGATHLQNAPQTQGVAAGQYTRGECTKCPTTFVQAGHPVTPQSDPQSNLSFGGSSMKAFGKVPHPVTQTNQTTATKHVASTQIRVADT